MQTAMEWAQLEQRPPLGKGEVVSSILTGSTTKAHEIRASDAGHLFQSATRYGTKRETRMSDNGESVEKSRNVLIPLTYGMDAIVDADLFEFLSQWRWQCQPGRHTGYAFRNTTVDGCQRTIWMHRLIIEAPDGFVVDHINHNGLDNRRMNLRVVTQSENLWNRRRPSLGITKRGNKWRAVIDHKNDKFEIGIYPDRETALAARQYVEAVLRGRPVPSFDELMLSPTIRKVLWDAQWNGA